MKVLQSQQEGKKVAEICREFGISEQTFYNWKSKYGGMTLSELQRVKELEAENARLKRIVADQQISIDAMIQREPNEGELQTDIIMLTHKTREKNIDAAIGKIEALSVVKGKITRLRLEELL